MANFAFQLSHEDYKYNICDTMLSSPTFGSRDLTAANRVQRHRFPESPPIKVLD